MWLMDSITSLRHLVSAVTLRLLPQQRLRVFFHLLWMMSHYKITQRIFGHPFNCFLTSKGFRFFIPNLSLSIVQIIFYGSTHLKASIYIHKNLAVPGNYFRSQDGLIGVTGCFFLIYFFMPITTQLHLMTMYSDKPQSPQGECFCMQVRKTCILRMKGFAWKEGVKHIPESGNYDFNYREKTKERNHLENDRCCISARRCVSCVVSYA